MQYFSLSQVPAQTHPSPTLQADQSNALFGSLIVTLPILVAVGILARQRHRALRLQRQIALLEKLWVQDSAKRSS